MIVDVSNEERDERNELIRIFGYKNVNVSKTSAKRARNQINEVSVGSLLSNIK